MEDKYIKAKTVFGKTFCLMQWQVNDVIANGGKVMEKDDMEFLLSLDGIKAGEIASFDSDDDVTYDSERFFTALEDAKMNGLLGLSISIATLKKEDRQKVRGAGYFIKDEGHGSVFWDEIYFTEEAYLKARISSFQNVFGGVASVAHLI